MCFLRENYIIHEGASMYDLMYVYVGARSRPPELTVQLVVVYGQKLL